MVADTAAPSDASDDGDGAALPDASAPEDAGPRVLEIGAGTYFVCARRDDDTTWCWGGDGYMEMGALSAEDVCNAGGFSPFNCRLMPAQRPDLDGVAQLAISGGVHGCVRRTDGTVACWGDNSLGQLGDGTRRARREVLAVPGVTDVVDLSCATYHCCAARRDGSVMCWGADQWNESGVDPMTVPCAIGTSITSMCRLRAGAVDGVTGAVQVATGDQQSCARRSDGTVVCWGRNNLGQLGDGTMMDRTTPVAVVGLANVQEVRAGGSHTCARVASGELWCWGSNAAAQLGDGTTTSRGDARAVPGLANVRAFSAGYTHTCAAVADGRLYCWGRNLAGQLGDGTRTQRLVPTLVPGLNNAGVVAASLDFTCAQTGAHGIACWGHNVGGQLGDGSQMDQNAPVAVNW